MMLKSASVAQSRALRAGAAPRVACPSVPVSRRASVIRRFKEDGKVEHASIVSLIGQDHSKIKSLWSEYKGSSKDVDTKQQLVWEIIREVSIHSSAEEEVLYPELRKRLGSEVQDHLLGHEGHQLLKDILSEVNGMTIEKNGEAAVTAKLEEAFKALDKHVEEEENDVLAKFQAAPGVDEETLARLGKSFTHAREHAVTRPHPWAPNRAPFNKVANPATAPLDAVADQIRFGGQPPKN